MPKPKGVKRYIVHADISWSCTKPYVYTECGASAVTGRAQAQAQRSTQSSRCERGVAVLQSKTGKPNYPPNRELSLTVMAHGTICTLHQHTESVGGNSADRRRLNELRKHGVVRKHRWDCEEEA